MIIFWGGVNTYGAVILGNFRNNHAGCHSIADMAGIIGGVVFKEVVGGIFMVAYTICVSSGLVGAATGLNALSDHSLCTQSGLFPPSVAITRALSACATHKATRSVVNSAPDMPQSPCRGQY